MAAAVLACGVLALLGGCEGGTGDLTGKVSMKGKPVVLGTVTVVAANGTTRAGTINSDGTYSVTGVPTGDVTVLVDSPKPGVGGEASGRGGRDGRGKAPPDLPKDAPKIERPTDTPVEVDAELAKKWFPISPRYTDPAQSGLKTTVRKGPNTFDIQLEP